MRKLPVLVLVAMTTLAAAPKKTPPAPPAPAAPPSISHPIAMFLDDLSRDGARQVTFRAAAVGTNFFFEESTGVTVYRYASGNYVRVEFLRGVKLAAAVKKYTKP